MTSETESETEPKNPVGFVEFTEIADEGEEIARDWLADDHGTDYTSDDVIVDAAQEALCRNRPWSDLADGGHREEVYSGLKAVLRRRLGVESKGYQTYYSGEFDAKVTIHHEDDGPIYLLKADPCPVCGGIILNVTFREWAQFVGSRTAEERGARYHADDGPWPGEVEFVRCPSCHTILYDEDRLKGDYFVPTDLDDVDWVHDLTKPFDVAVIEYMRGLGLFGLARFNIECHRGMGGLGPADVANDMGDFDTTLERSNIHDAIRHLIAGYLDQYWVPEDERDPLDAAVDLAQQLESDQ